MQQDREIGWEYRRRAEKHWGSMILFATLLLISHLLEIKPADIDAEGIKIAVEDVSVIRGGLALVFLYYAFMTFQMYVSGSMLVPFSVNRLVARRMLRVARRTNLGLAAGLDRAPATTQVKRKARAAMILYQLVMAPFFLVITAIVMISLVLSAYDSYAFGKFALHKLTGSQEATRAIRTISG
jgi:hypothetical protein